MTLRDRLAAAARGGDLAALDLLIAALPPELPPAVRRVARDAEIRRLAAHIGSLLPDASPRRIAGLSQGPARELRLGVWPFLGSEFAAFTTAEATAIASRIALILA